ncbi:hypothetical protein ACEPT7_26035 [Burkholderia ubonensis]|uniref:hypothetical protein n=1 Tax=Burkholderia ubonensis TaxID=101571 RepID=UPI00358F3B68
MNSDDSTANPIVPADSAVERIRTELEKLNPSTKRRILEKFALAALGSIPWVGGYISALASVKADTEEKRRYVANLVTNAAGTRLCSDDVIRLFIDWLDTYHESHLAVIREIYTNPGSTRFDIWSAIYGDLVREDSAEADLYKLLIRDLSTGGVIRQARDTNADGQFLRKQTACRQAGPANATVESAFEGSKQYVLTELGKQFVHYSMNEVVQRVSGD